MSDDPSKLKFSLDTTYRQSFFLLRVHLEIAGQSAQISSDDGHLTIGCRDSPVSITFDSLTTDVDTIVKKYGLEGVSNYWCKDVPMFELKLSSQDGLKRFLRSKDKVQNDLASRVAAMLAQQQKSPEPVYASTEVYMLTPHPESKDAHIVSVSSDNLVHCITIWRESVVFDIEALFQAFQKRIQNQSEVTLKFLTLELHEVIDWFGLGLYLGIPSVELQSIEYEPTLHDINERRRKMLSVWLKRLPKPSWSRVVKALMDLGHETLAQRIAIKYGVPAPVKTNIEKVKRIGAKDRTLERKNKSLVQARKQRDKENQRQLQLNQIIKQKQRKIKELVQEKMEVEEQLQLKEQELQLFLRTEEDNEQLKIIIRNKEEEIKELRQSIDRVKSELASERNLSQKLREEHEQVTAELKNMSTRVREQEKAYRDLKIRLEKEREIVDKLRMQQTSASTSKDHYTREIEDQLSTTRQESERETLTISQKEEEIKTLSQQVQDHEARIVKLERESALVRESDTKRELELAEYILKERDEATELRNKLEEAEEGRQEAIGRMEAAQLESELLQQWKPKFTEHDEVLEDEGVDIRDEEDEQKDGALLHGTQEEKELLDSELSGAKKFHGELGDFIDSLQATKQKVQRNHSLKLEVEELKAGCKNLQDTAEEIRAHEKTYEELCSKWDALQFKKLIEALLRLTEHDVKSIEETLQKLEAFYASYNEISTSVDVLHDQLKGFSASAIASEEVEYKKKGLQELVGKVGIQRSKFKELLSSCDLWETPYDKSQFESDVHELEAKIDKLACDVEVQLRALENKGAPGEREEQVPPCCDERNGKPGSPEPTGAQGATSVPGREKTKSFPRRDGKPGADGQPDAQGALGKDSPPGPNGEVELQEPTGAQGATSVPGREKTKSFPRRDGKPGADGQPDAQEDAATHPKPKVSATQTGSLPQVAKNVTAPLKTVAASLIIVAALILITKIIASLLMIAGAVAVLVLVAKYGGAIGVLVAKYVQELMKRIVGRKVAKFIGVAVLIIVAVAVLVAIVIAVAVLLAKIVSALPLLVANIVSAVPLRVVKIVIAVAVFIAIGAVLVRTIGVTKIVAVGRKVAKFIGVAVLIIVAVAVLVAIVIAVAVLLAKIVSALPLLVANIVSAVPLRVVKIVIAVAVLIAIGVAVLVIKIGVITKIAVLVALIVTGFFIFRPQVINCGPLDEPKNGFVSLSGTAEGATATYSCKPGFLLEPEGENIRVCNHSGNWTGSVPKCRRINCGSLDDPKHGTVSSNGTTMSAIATYSCNAGFVLVGKNTRVCDRSGKWTGSVPECKRVECSIPKQLHNGTVCFNGIEYNKKVEYKCDEGYSLVGPSIKFCQSNGTWSEDLEEPFCKCHRVHLGAWFRLVNEQARRDDGKSLHPQAGC